MSSVYTVSQDGLVTGVTIFTLVLLGGLSIAFLASAVFVTVLPTWTRLIFGAVVVLCLGILAVGYAYSTRGYRLDDRALVVVRPAGDVVFQVSDIREIRAEPAPFHGSIRIGGNGGLFGFWGKFRSEPMGGVFTAYATRRDRGVVLKLDDRTVVLTPDEPERLVAEVQARKGSG